MKRSKVIAIGLVCFMLGAGILTALGTRTITDSSDTVYTMITNSKGNSWAATGANLKLAIKDCANVTNTVYLPSGTITGCNDVYLWSNVSLKGSGIYSTILKADAGYSYGVIYVPEGNDNFSISDLTIDGSRASVVGQNGIYVRRSSDFTVSHVNIKSCDTNGIFIQAELPDTAAGNSKRFTLDHIYVNDLSSVSYEAIALNNFTDCQISNIHVKDCTASYVIDFHGMKNSTVTDIETEHSGGIKIFGEGSYYCSNNTVNGVIIRNSTQTDDYCLWISRALHTDVSGVHTEDGKHGVRVEYSKHITLTSVDIITPFQTGLNIYYSSFVDVVGLKTYKAVTLPIYLYHSDNVTLSVGRCYGSQYGSIDSCKDFSISQYTFEEMSSFGIGASASSFFDISNSKFYNCGSAGFDTVGYTACNNYTIHDSLFRGSTKAMDILSTDNYLTVHDNVCKLTDEIDMNNGGTNTTKRFFHNNVCVYMT